MTFGVLNVLGVLALNRGEVPPKFLLFSYDHWPYWQRKLYDYAIACHCGHLLELLVAMVCYLVLFPATMPDAATIQFGWIAKVVAFNLACMFVCCGGWHWFTYSSHFHVGMQKGKYNPKNQYEKDAPDQVKMFQSSTGNLEREIFFNTLGWLQSSAYQCTMMHLWASGVVPYYDSFWSVPAWSLFHLAFVTYWREFHFYWCHRAIHPWWKGGTLATGDLGAFLYKHVHSLHHKSHNPGPWSGLSMHPVEHFLYYTCTLLPLFFKAHPLHFLYAKFHADIAPIGGHDGYELEGGDFHWLHHAKYECNYGVPLIDFDRMFGTWVDYSDYKATGSLKAAREAGTKKKAS